MLAWHHEPLSYQAGAQPKRDSQKERACWLAGAAGLLGDQFDTLKALVCAKLDTLVRASALVEMVHALMRPDLQSWQGQITPETCKLLMCDHHHRRSQSGQRPGKAPLDLLTGKP